MIGLPSLRVGRPLAAAAAVVAVLWLSGCDNRIEYARYPVALAYPVRTDLLVSKAPTDEPFAPPGPGHLDEEIAQINGKGGETFNPNDAANFPAADRDALKKSLDQLFGTPRLPRIGPRDLPNDDDGKKLGTQLAALKLRDADGKDPFATLAHGSELYRYHCVHCHGLTGDGRGPTGPWLNPHPRDYRQGLFKFMSTAIYVNPAETDPEKKNKPDNMVKRKPRREDLLRTLHNGIEGTSMPSFGILGEDDLNALASYVIHLSIRGEVEFQVMTNKIHDGADVGSDTNNPDAIFATILGAWAQSAELPPITPEPGSYKDSGSKERAESIRRGYRLFSDMKGRAGCISCHVDYGRQVPFKYDLWGTLVRPMNLTAGVYRGGRRPIDIFWRIRGGVVPSGMPPNLHVPAYEGHEEKGLKEDEAWDVVNFVQYLPYPQMLPDDVRDKVYGPVEEKPSTERAEN